jgi:fatty acid desaturase
MSAAAAHNAESTEWPLTGSEILAPKRIKALQKRTDLDGVIYFTGHVLTQIATGFLIWLSSASLLAVPAILLHGFVLSLWFAPMHECTHGTAFRTRALSRFVGLFAGFLIWRPPLYFKYRHAAHHTFTQHPQQDPDIVRMPRSVKEYVAVTLGLSFWSKLFVILVRSARGRFDAVERSFIPPEELARVRDETRIFFLLYAAIIVGALATGLGFELLLYWVLPRLGGEPFLRLIRIAEHTGAAESPDLLENTRTVLANPVLRFMFWNMPYHAEHHLLPSLPFHALPALHAEVRPHLRCMSSSYWCVHRDLWARLRSGSSPHPASAA